MESGWRGHPRRTIQFPVKKVAVFYNPLSGGRRERRQRDVEDVLTVLRGAGIEAGSAPTSGHEATRVQVRQALAGGCETVFACGGDGTIHDVAQELAGSHAALGIIPLGTANALAHDLALPLRPVAAAQAALKAELRRIAVGRVEYSDLTGNTAARFFLVTAGVGVDAKLFHRLDPFAKRRLGMVSYYAEALHLWLTDRMENFSVEVAANNGGACRSFSDVSQLLAVRIHNFGGVVRELAPGAFLDRNDFRVVLFRTRSRMRYLAYILRGLAGAKWQIGGIDLCSATSLECRYVREQSPDSRIFVEADGELLGTLPVRISIVPDALTLLAPKRRL
jgi:diacylglycerol kinase (ATP)